MEALEHTAADVYAVTAVTVSRQIQNGVFHFEAFVHSCNLRLFQCLPCRFKSTTNPKNLDQSKVPSALFNKSV